eukprot:jgi/Mesvir1/26136/Mv06849-RA.1
MQGAGIHILLAQLHGEHFIADVDASKLVPQSGFPTCLLARSRNATLASKKQVDSSFPELVVACKVEGSFPQYTLAVGDACTMVDKKAESALLMAFDLQCDHNLLVVAIADVLLGVVTVPEPAPSLTRSRIPDEDVWAYMESDEDDEADPDAAQSPLLKGKRAKDTSTTPRETRKKTGGALGGAASGGELGGAASGGALGGAASGGALGGAASRDAVHATVASLEAKVKQHGEKLEAFGKSRTAVEQRLTTLAKQVSGFSRAVTGAKSDIKKTVTDTVTAEVKKLQPAAAAPQLPPEFNALKKDLAAAQKTVEDQGKKIAALEWQIQHVQATQNTMMSVQVPTWPAAAAYPPAAGPTNLPSAGKPRQHPRPRHPQPYPQQQVPTPLLAYTHGYEDEEEAEELEEAEEYEELEEDARRGGYTPPPSKKRPPPMRAVATRSSPRKNKGRIASAYVDEHFRGYRC